MQRYQLNVLRKLKKLKHLSLPGSPLVTAKKNQNNNNK